jgi:hypothetical protein
MIATPLHHGGPMKLNLTGILIISVIALFIYLGSPA